MYLDRQWAESVCDDTLTAICYKAFTASSEGKLGNYEAQNQAEISIGLYLCQRSCNITITKSMSSPNCCHQLYAFCNHELLLEIVIIKPVQV